MNTRGIFRGTFCATGGTSRPFVPFLFERGLPRKARNPIASNVRSVAQPGSASGLGKVVLAAVSRDISTPSLDHNPMPWHFAWDFLRAVSQPDVLKGEMNGRDQNTDDELPLAGPVCRRVQRAAKLR